jgi:hypothetical protein
MSRERPLGCHRSGDRIPRAREGDEKAVPLVIRLQSTPRLECIPKEPPMVIKHLPVACITEGLKQTRGPLNVGEEEGDRPGW